MPRASSRSSASASVELLLRAPSSSCVGRVGILVRACPGRGRSVQRQRDEPLLGAVVQVALQPPALLRAGLDDPGARGAQLLDAGAQLGLQALVLDRQAGGGRDRAHSSGLLATASRRARSRRRAGPRARPASRRARRRPRRAARRLAVGVDPAPLVVEPEHELQRAVAERVGEAAAQVARAGRLAEPRAAAPTPRRRATTRLRTRPIRNTHGTDAKTIRPSVPSTSVSRWSAGRVRRRARPASSTSITTPDHSTGASARRCGAVAARQRRSRITSTTATTRDADHGRDRVDDVAQRVVVLDQQRRRRAAVALHVRVKPHSSCGSGPTPPARSRPRSATHATALAAGPRDTRAPCGRRRRSRGWRAARRP